MRVVVGGGGVYMVEKHKYACMCVDIYIYVC